MVGRRSITLPAAVRESLATGQVRFADRGLFQWLGRPRPLVQGDFTPLPVALEDGVCTLRYAPADSSELPWSLDAPSSRIPLHQGDELVLRSRPGLDGAVTITGEFNNGAAAFVRHMWQRADAGVGRRIAAVTPPGLLELPRARDFEHADRWRGAARDVVASYILLSIGRLAPLGFETRTNVRLEVVGRTAEEQTIPRTTDALRGYAPEMISRVVRLCATAHDVLGPDVAPLGREAVESALRAAAGAGPQ
jgi:hypothetical protein